MKNILVTGATGKVGMHFIQRMLSGGERNEVTIRALCHNRRPEPHPQMEIVTGSIDDREAVRAAMCGITHVVTARRARKVKTSSWT